MMPPPLDDIDLWTQLSNPQSAELMAILQTGDVADVRFVEQLRKSWDASLLRVAVELMKARAKAQSKFSNYEGLFADVQGIEQASSETVARHKANRFKKAGAHLIYDLCCGIGGDAMSLSSAAKTICVDLDPVRSWMTSKNTSCETLTADVQELELSDVFFHLDPSRRIDAGGFHSGGFHSGGLGSGGLSSGGSVRRIWRYEDYQPGPAFIESLLGKCPDGAVKLSPGIQFDALPALESREIEIISENNSLTQAVLYSGQLAFHPGQRTATRLPDSISYTARPDNFASLPLAPLSRYLFVVDPAIERAGIMGPLACELALTAPHPKLGLFSGPELLESPWLRPFELLADLPWREKKVREWLTAHDAGLVIVKTRDKTVNPDFVQSRLRGKGDETFTVFVLRMDKRVRALITRDLSS